MLNKCMFIGHLGADPESRSFQNGGEVVNLRLAVTERWKDKSGQRQERTEWVRVSIFSDGLCRVAKQYLRKGSKVYIEGKQQTRKWQNQSGQDQYSTEIVLQGYDAKLVMLDGKASGGARSEYEQPAGGFGGSSGFGAGQYDDLEDDVPF